MKYELPEPVIIDRHIPTNVVIRGYKAEHLHDAFAAGAASRDVEIDKLSSWKGGGIEVSLDAWKSLNAEIEALRKDAMRYRWLRMNLDDSIVMYGDTRDCQLLGEEELDSAIDAAIAEEGNTNG